MSLLRLLTAGKCLVGLQKTEVRYHLPGQEALPKFGSKKNPFRATALPEPPEPAREREIPAQVNPLIQDDLDGKHETPRSIAAAGDSRAAVVPADDGKKKPDGNECKPSEPAARPPSAVKAFLLWGRAKKAKRTNIGGRSLVQGELSLEKVKVVRNDLSECDLEIVRRASQPTAQPAELKTGVGAKAPAPDAGWGAAAGRLFGIGKT